jgi:hypothetical protein
MLGYERQNLSQAGFPNMTGTRTSDRFKKYIPKSKRDSCARNSFSGGWTRNNWAR